MIDHFQYGIPATFAYIGVSAVLMVAGYFLVEILIPGKLRKQIWEDANYNVAIMLSAGLLSTSIILFVAIWTSGGGDHLGDGLISTAVYGLLGLVIQAVVFVIVDALTPGKLRETIADKTAHPAAIVIATIHLVTGIVVAAAIS